MIDQFPVALAIVELDEGAISMDPHDPGNWTGGQVGQGLLRGTNTGISAASYPTLDISSLTQTDISGIYRRDFWDKNSCGLLAWPVSLVVFDGEVNSGSEGARALQEALGIDADGSIGPVTLMAASKCNPVDLACRVSAKRAEWYTTLTAASRYGDGWLTRLFSNLWKAARTI